MGAVKKARELSIQMLQLLDNPTNIPRSQLIEQLTELVDEREKVIHQIKPPYSDEEKKIGKEIVAMNQQIEDKMNELFSNLKEDMRQFKHYKNQNKSYINPYAKIETTDGMYVDRKK